MKELQQASLLPTDYTKDTFPKKAAKFVLKKAIRFAPASVLIFTACPGGSGTEKNTKELESTESGYSLPFPKGETWFLTDGPHEDGYSNGVKYAIDIAPPEGGDCSPFGIRRSIENRIVTASASGEVIAKGDDKNRNDLHHSEIRIKDKDGLTQVYIHLDKTKVNVGDKVKQGAPLGNPSCEYPPGGENTGPHVHVGLMKDGKAIPIDGVVVGGWTIHEGVNGREGTMAKNGEKTRTADKGRFGENSTGIRNDLPNTSNKAVIASPKDRPIPPISGKVKEKSVAETPKATSPAQPEGKITISKTPEDLYRTLTSTQYTKYLPSGMSVFVNPSGTINHYDGRRQIRMSIDDERSNPLKGQGIPNASLEIYIYDSNQDAQAAYTEMATLMASLGTPRPIPNFPYRAFIIRPIGGGNLAYALGSGNLGYTQIENVIVACTVRGNDINVADQRTIELMRAMPKLLQDAGN